MVGTAQVRLCPLRVPNAPLVARRHLRLDAWKVDILLDFFFFLNLLAAVCAQQGWRQLGGFCRAEDGFGTRKIMRRFGTQTIMVG